MKRFVCVIVFCFDIGLKVSGQDIHFSQFYENPIMRNPALTAIFTGDYKAGVNYRTQWGDISVPFQTALASCETRIEVAKNAGDYLSFGLATTYDHAGSIDFNSLQLYPAISYNKCLEDLHNSYLSLGFTAGYIQRSVDYSKMTFSSQFINGSYSGSNPTGENMAFRNIVNYDLGTGVSLNSSLGEYNHTNYYVGVAAYHITQPTQTFGPYNPLIRLTTKWEGNMGFKFQLDPQVGLVTHFNYSFQEPYQELIGGGLLSYKGMPKPGNPNFILYAGCFFRLNDALIPVIKVDYANYSITVSYDVNTSSLRTASEGVGGFEISLFVKGNFKKGLTTLDLTKCPRFE